MKIVLLHPPHSAIGSRYPRTTHAPFGLLSLGPPLIEAGHDVRQLNVDPPDMPVFRIVESIWRDTPDIILIGHRAAESDHEAAVETARAVRQARPGVRIIYGGIYPARHWRSVLEESHSIDAIVRLAGAGTVIRLLAALSDATPLADVPGIAYRTPTGPQLSGAATGKPAGHPGVRSETAGFEAQDQRSKMPPSGAYRVRSRCA